MRWTTTTTNYCHLSSLSHTHTDSHTDTHMHIYIIFHSSIHSFFLPSLLPLFLSFHLLIPESHLILISHSKVLFPPQQSFFLYIPFFHSFIPLFIFPSLLSWFSSWNHFILPLLDIYFPFFLCLILQWFHHSNTRSVHSAFHPSFITSSHSSLSALFPPLFTLTSPLVFWFLLYTVFFLSSFSPASCILPWCPSFSLSFTPVHPLIPLSCFFCSAAFCLSFLLSVPFFHPF